MVSARSRESPESIIVASCRAMIARSLSVTLSPKPGIEISLLSPEVPTSLIDMGARPIVLQPVRDRAWFGPRCGP